MKPLTILLVNVHSSLNAGDLALLECARAQFDSENRPARIIVSANWPNEPYYAGNNIQVVPSPWWLAGAGSGRSILVQILRLLGGIITAWLAALGLPAATGSTWKATLQAYQQADLVVGVAGNQFYSTGRYGWPFPLHAFSIYLAHLFRKPFYTMPQSLGPLRRWWERALIRWLYGKGRQIYLRDQVSMDLAKKIGISPRRLFYAPDPAFSFPAGEEQPAREILQKYGWESSENTIGVTIIASMGRSLASGRIDHYYQVMAKVLAQAVQELSARIFLFIQVSGPTAMENDRTAALHVLDLIPEPARSQIVLVDEALHPTVLKACYGQMAFFLATRLHSGIFSLGMHVPTLFVGYLTKTQGVLKSLGIENWCISLADLGEVVLWQALLEAWNERQARREFLQRTMPQIAQQAQQTASEILLDWSKPSE